MIMDSLASLALATELPTDELLERPPYRKNEYIINRKMVKHIGG
jgi:magnesium-transporting ATPase (P-type)